MAPVTQIYLFILLPKLLHQGFDDFGEFVIRGRLEMEQVIFIEIKAGFAFFIEERRI
jgi:hypothetical protein